MLIKARILVASVSPGLKWTRLHEESSLSKLAGVEEMETRGREHWLMLTAFLASVFSYCVSIWPPDFVFLVSPLSSSDLELQTREGMILFQLWSCFEYGC